MEAQARTQTKATAVPFEVAYHDQGEDDYDDADEGGPLPKLTDDPADLAPFIPADKAAVLSALRLTGAGPKDRLIDIGCGDGRFCVAAAQCAGVARAVGVEHDARLIARCRERAAACGLSADAVQFIEADATALDFAALDMTQGPITIAVSFLTSDVEGVEGITSFLQLVAARGGQVVSVHFPLSIAGLRLVAEDTEHRVLVYKSA